MMTHSMAPPTGVWKLRAIEGRLMLTIEASSMIMNVPIATRMNVIQGFTGPCRGPVSITVPSLGVSLSSLGGEGWGEEAVFRLLLRRFMESDRAFYGC